MAKQLYTAFEITMNNSVKDPNRRFINIVSVNRTKFTLEKFSKLHGTHSYSFGDGWIATIEVKEVTGTEKRRLDKLTQGFMGYEWMVHSLRWYGKIMNDKEREEFVAKQGKAV